MNTTGHTESVEEILKDQPRALAPLRESGTGSAYLRTSYERVAGGPPCGLTANEDVHTARSRSQRSSVARLIAHSRSRLSHGVLSSSGQLILTSAP